MTIREVPYVSKRTGEVTIYLKAITRDARGKQISAVVNSRKEGEEWIAARKAEQMAGLVPNFSRRRFGKVAEDWLEELRADEIEGEERIAFQQHEYAVRELIVPQLGHVKLSELSPRDCRDFFRWLARPLTSDELVAQKRREQRSGRKGRKGGALSLATQRRVRVTLNAILAQARQDGHLQTDPLRDVKLKAPKGAETPEVAESARTRNRPNRAEWQAIIAAAKTFPPFEKAVALTLNLLGIRGQELLALRWKHVDFDARRIGIREALDHKGRVKVTKTASGRRDLDNVHDDVIEALRELREARTALPENRRFLGPDDLIFCNRAGGQFGHGNMSNRVYSRVQVAAGVTRTVTRKGAVAVVGKYGLHAGRHALASLAIHTGDVSLPDLSKHLGHKNVATTLAIYVHEVTSAMERGAALSAMADKAMVPNVVSISAARREKHAVSGR
ncbi:tyrosine-type recombinase/integrase [Nostoc sp. NIES-2111]